MRVFMFSGQGSQRRGMGGDLFDRVAEFVRCERDIDHVLGYSIRRLCLEDPDQLMNDTRYTQPALFIVNALHFYDAVNHGDWPDFVVGHSLGECNALHAAGVFDLLIGVRLVKARGESMAAVSKGAMAAVGGLDAQRLLLVMQENELSMLEIANYNSRLQHVIAGPTEEIGRAEALFKRAGATLYLPLRVSAAFHSRYMREASVTFGAFLSSIEDCFRVPKIPVISSVTAKLYPPDASGSTIREHLTGQLTQPVLWMESMRRAMDLGATSFRETGPSQVLSGLLREITTATAA